MLITLHSHFEECRKFSGQRMLQPTFSSLQHVFFLRNCLLDRLASRWRDPNTSTRCSDIWNWSQIFQLFLGIFPASLHHYFPRLSSSTSATAFHIGAVGWVLGQFPKYTQHPATNGTSTSIANLKVNFNISISVYDVRVLNMGITMTQVLPIFSEQTFSHIRRHSHISSTDKPEGFSMSCSNILEHGPWLDLPYATEYSIHSSPFRGNDPAEVSVKSFWMPKLGMQLC